MIVTGVPPQRYKWAEETLVDRLNSTAARFGDRLAFIDGPTVTTWAEVRERARALARGLLAIGIQRGDHIAIWLPNSAEFFIAWLASAHVGAVVIPVNTRYRQREFNYLVSHCDARVLFMIEGFLSHNYRRMVEEGPVAQPDEFTRLEFIASFDSSGPGLTVDALVADGMGVTDEQLDSRARQVEPGDTTIIIYTSGSTGVPKGVMHSHNVLRNECAITEWLAIDENSRILGHMPFFHVAGGLSALLPALISGGSVVLLDHWDPSRALDVISEQRVSVFGGIATHFIDLINHPQLDAYDLRCLRTGWIGGSMNPREVLQAVHSRLAYQVFPVYGMTETASVTTYPRPSDELEVFLSGKGVPISDFEIKVIDVETGAELSSDASGEICIRGHVVMQGYYKMPEATAAVVDKDGWFHTGDVGRFDDDGYLSIVGRVKDMYIVGGNNVYPAEVEAVIASWEVVRHAQVIAVPDARLGEVGYAFIEAIDGEAPNLGAAIQYCESRMADFKVPRHWELVHAWPLLDNGKVNRVALQAAAIERLGLGDLAMRRLLRDDGRSAAGFRSADDRTASDSHQSQN
jgi:acyl-CoA synthetase (AMP-forming)/AMP-acid ligase II